VSSSLITKCHIYSHTISTFSWLFNCWNVQTVLFEGLQC